ncbi:MAG: hypothetical protein QNK23_14695 [Crocinitomicaceae bacterium]|nr:hypothetical protein [Crocinitomicaceae bacterium]
MYKTLLGVILSLHFYSCHAQVSLKADFAMSNHGFVGDSNFVKFIGNYDNPNYSKKIGQFETVEIFFNFFEGAKYFVVVFHNFRPKQEYDDIGISLNTRHETVLFIRQLKKVIEKAQLKEPSRWKVDSNDDEIITYDHTEEIYIRPSQNQASDDSYSTISIRSAKRIIACLKRNLHRFHYGGNN